MTFPTQNSEIAKHWMSKSSVPDVDSDPEDEIFVRPSDHLPDVPTKTSWQDKMEDWHPKPDYELQDELPDHSPEYEAGDIGGSDFEEPKGLEEEPQGPEAESEGLEEGQTAQDDYFKATEKSLAFQWLQSMLQRDLTLHSPKQNLMKGIGQQISHILPKPRINSNQGTETHKMIFELAWNPIAFLRAQKYSQAHNDIANAITLTGTPRDCQALSVCQYLRQTWPMSSGLIIQLIQDLVSQPGIVHQS